MSCQPMQRASRGSSNIKTIKPKHAGGMLEWHDATVLLMHGVPATIQGADEEGKDRED